MPEEIEESEVNWEDYESGPFCPHWLEAGECDEKCKCGHLCGVHWWDDDCSEDKCPCEKFEDVKQEDSKK